jgi:hypothetical protein
VSKLSRDGGLTHGDLPQILCAFVSWLFKTRIPQSMPVGVAAGVLADEFALHGGGK